MRRTFWSIAGAVVWLTSMTTMAQTIRVEPNATTKLAQASAPNTALARLLNPVDNQAFECGEQAGWNIECLRSRYQEPLGIGPSR